MPRYALNPGLKMDALDVAGASPRYLIELDGARRFEVSRLVRTIVEVFADRELTADEVANDLRQIGFASANAEVVSRIVKETLLPRGIVYDSSEPPPERTSMPKGALTVRVPLFGPEVIGRLTSALRVLFIPSVRLAMISLAVITHLFFYIKIFPAFNWRFSELPLTNYLWLLIALNITTLFHEIGHATACRFYNIRHGKIGWGIYLYMFALYTDVSAAWKLPRRQRAMVDCGGMYFELIAASIVCGLFIRSRNEFFIYLFLILDLGILNTLNPILKQDGYWLVSDLLGISNLRDVATEATFFWIGKLFGSSRPSPRLNNLPARVRAALYSYAAISVAFFAGFSYWLGMRVVVEVIPAYPRLIATLMESHGAGAWTAAFRLLVLSVFLLFLAIALYRFVRFLYRVFASAMKEAGKAPLEAPAS